MGSKRATLFSAAHLVLIPAVAEENRRVPKCKCKCVTKVSVNWQVCTVLTRFSTYYSVRFELSIYFLGYASPSGGLDPVSLTGVGQSMASEAAAAAVGGNLSDGNYKQQDLRRTPSTSAIYETLRRSKELRESLSSRPSSRLSIDNNMLASSGYRDSVRKPSIR